jgi:hypothetical protein
VASALPLRLSLPATLAGSALVRPRELEEATSYCSDEREGMGEEWAVLNLNILML